MYVQCILRGFTSILFCVPFIFANRERCRLAVAHDGFLSYKWKSSVLFVLATYIAEVLFEQLLTHTAVQRVEHSYTTKSNGYFTFQTIIDLTGARNAISFILYGMRGFTSHNNYLKKSKQQISGKVEILN